MMTDIQLSTIADVQRSTLADVQLSNIPDVQAIYHHGSGIADSPLLVERHQHSVEPA